MAGWISSKLKVAENLLQQIDQQAAESLRKNELSLSPDRREYDDEISKKGSSSSFSSSSATAADASPLKLQINKKSHRSNRPQSSRRTSLDPGPVRDVQFKASDSVGRVPAKSAVKVEDDWTELLSAAPAHARSGGVVLERQGSARRLGVAERKSNVSNVDGSLRKINSPRANTNDGGKGDRKDRGAVGVLERARLLDNVASKDGAGDAEKVTEGVSVGSDDTGVGIGGGLVSRNESPFTGNIANVKGEMNDDDGEVRKTEEAYRSSTTVGSSAPYGSSASSERSDSESESGSSSDSENERESREEERKRRERMIAEKAAAMAAEAVKERENVVARLEGEKQSLEKILEERKKQQAEEASELQTSMMETMEAVELEKQRHNSTRMEALACLAALESTNAKLAKSLATTQWNLETEVKRVVDLRQQIEFKKLAQEGVKQKLRKLQSSRSRKEESKGTEYEQGMLEAEYSFVCDKLLQMKEKAKKMEDDIGMTKKEMAQPSLIELELKGRLDQLTDRLIQKQTQIETLSAEKAMLLFKIESVSRYLHDGGLSSNNDDVAVDVGASTAGFDVGAGSWDPSFKPSTVRFSRIRAAESHLLSFIRQMDALFSVGVLFLRRNPNARVWSVIYLLLLHTWVVYVFFSHSKPTNPHGSGAVFSLENINKTAP